MLGLLGRLLIQPPLILRIPLFIIKKECLITGEKYDTCAFNFSTRLQNVFVCNWILYTCGGSIMERQHLKGSKQIWIQSGLKTMESQFYRNMTKIQDMFFVPTGQMSTHSGNKMELQHMGRLNRGSE